MDQHFSTLELVKHDKTTRAPERDYDATAFELDTDALAPQVVPDTTPQVFYNSSFPEPHGDNEENTIERASSFHIMKSALKWPLILMTLVIAAAIAIGVVVGIWSRREHLSLKPSTTTSSAVPPAAQFILNDTSLAVFSLVTGDRWLFFQDTNNGLIRRAIYTSSNNQWSTSPSLNASFNPKMHTPLAANIPKGFQNDSHDLMIELYFVSENNTLNSSIFWAGSWEQNSLLENYSTAVDMRSLSVSSTLSGSPPTCTNSDFLYYENSNGTVSMLLRDVPFKDEISLTYGVLYFGWVDITRQVSRPLPDTSVKVNTSWSLGTSGILSPPFTSAGNWSGYSVGALISSPGPYTAATDNGPLATGNFAMVFDQIPDANKGWKGGYQDGYFNALGIYSTSIHQSDIALFDSNFAMCINRTQPALIGAQENEDGITTPDNAFPFARLASVSLADGSATYLYHQMNGTTFAEEKWSVFLGAWEPAVYIDISGF